MPLTDFEVREAVLHALDKLRKSWESEDMRFEVLPEDTAAPMAFLIPHKNEATGQTAYVVGFLSVAIDKDKSVRLGQALRRAFEESDEQDG